MRGQHATGCSSRRYGAVLSCRVARARERAPLSLTLGVRPARALVLVPQIDEVPWMRTFEAAIAAQMRCWGGGANLVVPYSDDLADNPLFWQLADRLDPDQVRIYTGSVAELEHLDPDRYREAEQATLAQLAEMPQEMRRSWWEDWRALQLVEYQIPAALCESATRRLALLELPGWEEWVWTNGASEPLEPFTDVAFLRELPNVITDVGRENIDDLERLLLTVEVGRLSPAMRAALEQRGVEVQTEELRGRAPARSMIFRRQPSDNVYPLAVSELGLEWYRSGRFQVGAAPIVVGDDPWDFALFYALRRWRSVAYWLPQSALDDDTYCRHVLVSLEMRGQAATRGAVVVSASSADLAAAAHERLTATQRNLASSRPPRVELEVGRWEVVLPGPLNRLYERDNFDRPVALYLHEGRTPELPTPTPELVSTEEVHTLRWFTDVAVDGWGALRDSDLGRVLLTGRGIDAERLRVGRDAPSYLSPQAITFARQSPKTAALRPQLVPLPLAEQLRRVAARGGWRLTQSDKGVYAAESAKLFGDERELAAVLRDRTVRRVIDAFVVGDLEGAAGRLLADRRRYLTYTDFGSAAGADDAAAALERLEGAAAVTRGLVLKCQRCRAGGFYTPIEFDPTFRCKSCRLEQRPTRASWLEAVEPVWHYSLDEVLRRFVAHNGHLPLFAIVDLLGDAEASVELAFELEFRRSDEEEIEFDIVARSGSELWLGDATTRDRFAEGGARERARLDLIHRLADELNARRVVLASSQTFREATRTEAHQRLCSHWYELHLIEGVALDAPEPAERAATVNGDGSSSDRSEAEDG